MEEDGTHIPAPALPPRKALGAPTTMGKESGRRRESSEQQRCWLLQDVSTEQGSSLRLFIFTR